jgi:hypothetical protein
MEVGMKNREWTDIPPDVHEKLREIKRFLEHVACRLTDKMYACEGNREGMAMDCGFEANSIDFLLMDYGLPSRWDPDWVWEPETEEEAIERKLLKKG